MQRQGGTASTGALLDHRGEDDSAVAADQLFSAITDAIAFPAVLALNEAHSLLLAARPAGLPGAVAPSERWGEVLDQLASGFKTGADDDAPPTPEAVSRGSGRETDRALVIVAAFLVAEAVKQRDRSVLLIEDETHNDTLARVRDIAGQARRAAHRLLDQAEQEPQQGMDTSRSTSDDPTAAASTSTQLGGPMTVRRPTRSPRSERCGDTVRPQFGWRVRSSWRRRIRYLVQDMLLERFAARRADQQLAAGGEQVGHVGHRHRSLRGGWLALAAFVLAALDLVLWRPLLLFLAGVVGYADGRAQGRAAVERHQNWLDRQRNIELLEQHECRCSHCPLC